MFSLPSVGHPISFTLLVLFAISYAVHNVTGTHTILNGRSESVFRSPETLTVDFALLFMMETHRSNASQPMIS